MLGLNYRMSEPQAALGRSQLRRMDENLARRRENFETIAAILAGVDGVTIVDAKDDRAQSSWYCLTAVLEPELAARRLELIEDLKSRGVGTSLYYPQPVPRMRYYAEKYGYDAARVPNAEAISDRSIAFPVGPHLSPDDARFVGDATAEVCSA
jgi:dTDP-4-amino-4,6-dideoxygalactose transaminase